MIIRKIRSFTGRICRGIWTRSRIVPIGQFTTGFFFGKPSEEAQIYDSNTYIREYTYLGITEEIKDGMVKIEQRNKFSVGLRRLRS